MNYFLPGYTLLPTSPLIPPLDPALLANHSLLVAAEEELKQRYDYIYLQCINFNAEVAAIAAEALRGNIVLPILSTFGDAQRQDMALFASDILLETKKPSMIK